MRGPTGEPTYILVPTEDKAEKKMTKIKPEWIRNETLCGSTAHCRSTLPYHGPGSWVAEPSHQDFAMANFLLLRVLGRCQQCQFVTTAAYRDVLGGLKCFVWRSPKSGWLALGHTP